MADPSLPPGLESAPNAVHTSSGGEAEWLPIKSLKQYTNAFIYDPDRRRVLLGYKKRGFGQGMYNINGFGGKKEPDETILQAAKRELKEESGIDAQLKYIGTLLFVVGTEAPAFDVHIFSASTYEGTPEETEEMRPQWFSYDDIPYADMWPDDIFWLPDLLAGKSFVGRADFAPPDATRGERSAGKMTRWWFGTLSGPYQ